MRPFPVLASMLALAALLPPSLQAQSPTAGPPIISGAGLVDFSQSARLKVGQWATYRITTVEDGTRREATQKVSIDGFETFGGERCAWIESAFTPAGSQTLYAKTLVSLKISKIADHEYIKALPMYQRKVQTYSELDGIIQEMDFPHVEKMGGKAPSGSSTAIDERRDTLPAMEVATDAGKYRCKPARLRRDVHMVNADKDGNRIYRRQYEEQVNYMCPTIPVSSLARQTYEMRLTLGPMPKDAPADFVPDVDPRVKRREAMLVAFGTGATTAFPRNAKTVPMNIPTQEVRSGPLAPGNAPPSSPQH